MSTVGRAVLLTDTPEDRERLADAILYLEREAPSLGWDDRDGPESFELYRHEAADTILKVLRGEIGVEALEPGDPGPIRTTK